MTYQVHNIPPVYDSRSKILILGSFPSVKSRETAFFYGHPQNRFWKVLSGLWEKECPKTVEEKKAFLLERHIAVWDVIKTCEIEGSGDSTIKNAVPNDLAFLLRAAPLERIFANGATAYRLYKKYYPDGPEIIKLPSTSPANAAYSIERLKECWRVIRE